MASIFKSLKPSDQSVVPFEAYYKFSYTYESGSVNNSEDISVRYGQKYPEYLTLTTVRTANINYDLLDSVKQTFYSPAPYASYGITTNAFVPENEVYVVSIGQYVYGEKIVPGSFNIKVGTSQSYDDARGNIIVSSSGTGSNVGRVFYDKGIAVIKPTGYTNLNPDPLWEDIEGGTYPDGWQHALERKLTSQLGVQDGVFHGFPRQDTYAAKIGTRTSSYITASGFYSMPVTAGEIYRISGWAYANGTTWRGIQAGGAPGTDYDIGYIVVLNGPTTEYVGLTTDVGPIGWNYLTKEIIIPSGITAISVGPYINGPYPAGFMYGDPVCTDEEALKGCPGYAWFAGLRVEKINPPLYNTLSGGGLTNQGLYIVNGTSMEINFSSSVTLYENIFRVTLDPTDFLYSFNNPSIHKTLSGSTVRAKDLMVKDELDPYVTTIGFYNEKNELLLVGKPSVPIKRTRDLSQTFIVKFDI